jgi:hypothetical protein
MWDTYAKSSSGTYFPTSEPSRRSRGIVTPMPRTSLPLASTLTRHSSSLTYVVNGNYWTNGKLNGL